MLNPIDFRQSITMGGAGTAAAPLGVSLWPGGAIATSRLVKATSTPFGYRRACSKAAGAVAQTSDLMRACPTRATLMFVSWLLASGDAAIEVARASTPAWR